MSTALPTIEPVSSPPPVKSGRWRLSRTASNTFYNIGTAGLSASGRSLLFMIGPILLTPAVFGVYAYYSWLGTVAIAIGSAGTVLAAQRLTCRYGSRARKCDFTFFLTVITLVLTALALIVMLLISHRVAGGVVVITAVCALAIAGSLVALQQALLQAVHNFRRPFIGESVSQVARFILLGVLKITQAIVPGWLLLLDTVVYITKSAVLFFRRPYTGLPQNPEVFDKPAWMVTLRTSILPVTAIAVLDTIVWQRGEMFFLGLYADTKATAYFASASQIGQIFVLAPMAALSSLIPRMAEKARHSANELNHAMNRILNLAILCAIPMYCAGLLLGPAIIRFWKPQYAPVAQILPLIMLGRMAMIVGAPISVALYASGRERAVFVVSSCSAIAALTIDYLLIPKFGFHGAAYACALNQIISAVATALAGVKYLKFKMHLQGLTIGILIMVVAAQIAFASTAWRTEAAVVGLFITIAVLLRDPFITRVIFPMLTHKAEA